MSPKFEMEFPGYTLLEQLGETHYSSVYRAQKENREGTVIIKVIRIKDPSLSLIARFKHEYELIRAITIDGIVKPIDFIDCEGTPAIVLEDFGGISLKEIIAKGVSLDRFLSLGIRLSEILGALHQCNVSHRDIKPHNILYNPETDTLKITDFGISAEINHAHEEIGNPLVIEGTLSYISPEQTGRMNCGVDYRTDLYSLGVTFYEMLTGRVPFPSKDPMEIIHAHIAKTPEPPHLLNPDIPVPVSDIVMKLLSKSTSDRYQSSMGLTADLRECRHQLNETGQIEPFKLASKDLSLRFNIPHYLAGRDEPLDLLHKAFDRVSQGPVEMVLVTGEPGIGKSALVHEIHKSVMEKQGYFISGKFDPFQRVIPYSGIIQAFQGLIRQLLAENDEKLGQWKKKLISALGQNGKIIVNVIPEIEWIIGSQPEIPELNPEASQNRFNLFFKNFVRVFADQTHPLVLFLDDLQWADSASLNLISTILTDRDLCFLLFVGSYRENELADHHPFMLTRETLIKAGIPIRTIHLGPLDVREINQLVSAFANKESGSALDLAQVIHAKTKGNPFFIHQFLKVLYEKKSLFYDSTAGWSWNLSGIRELHATENVVTFLAEKLHDLSPDPLSIIKLAACIGNHFDLDILKTIAERSFDEIMAIIDSLVQAEFLILTGEACRFYHHRIQEAAYALISKEERERTHYRIGMLAIERTPPEKLLNRIFYICDQLNLAGSCLSGKEDRLRLSELNLKAGIKAKESTAYAEALNYFKAGTQLLDLDSWQTHYSLTYALFTEYMECQYLNRNFDEAEKVFDIIITHAATRMDQAKAYYIMIVLYTNMKSPKDAVALGLKALLLYDLHVSADIGVFPVILELIKVKRMERKIGIENMIDLPLIEDEDLKACLQLLFAIGTPAYYLNPNLFAIMVLRGIYMGLIHGGTMRYASGGTMAMATIIQNGLGNFEEGYRLGEMALKMNERFDDRKTAGMVHHIFAFFLQHWRHHARQSLETYRKACQLSMNAGDFIFAGHSVNAGTDCSLMIGINLDEVFKVNNKHEALMSIVKDPFIAARFKENNQLILNLKGQTENRFSLSGHGYDEDAHIEQLHREKNLFGLCYTLCYKMKIYYLYGKFEEAQKRAVELSKYVKVQMTTQLNVECYFYASLTLTALALEQKKKSIAYRTTIFRNHRKLKKWAALCPENFQHKYDLVTAEIMAVKGRCHDALLHYHAAITGARKNQYVHEEAIACERLSCFYRGLNAYEEAGIFMRRAYRCYDSWGAKAKLDDLMARYPDLLDIQSSPSLTENPGRTTSSSAMANNIDFSTVMKVSQVISGEIMLDRLLKKTMHLSITNAGAERGCLIFESTGRLIVQAKEDVSTGENNVLQSIPLDMCDGLSPAIVNYVYHSGESLILNHASNEGPFVNDPHVLALRCKSILCIPIMNKGKLACILYMENNLTARAFTADRLEILRVITAQAAISLQNARLYEEISNEITVRKEAEESMRSSEEKYRTILEEMQDAYCETDLEGTITFINPSACTITGYASSELVGLQIRNIVLPSEKKTLVDYYLTIYETGHPGKPLPCTLIGKEGTGVPLEIVTSLIRNKSGHPMGFRNVGRDVSERKRLENDLVESSKNVHAARAATILGLAKLAEYRDEETGTHLERIREYARMIARALSKKKEYRKYITEEYIEDIYNSSILHDIGKVGVPDAILLKPGKLTPEEFEIIKTHTTLGGDALKAVEAKIEGQTFLTLGKEIAFYHHEKWDGSGYPKGLKGEEIPLSARIVAIADVYDALTSKRVYKEAFSHQKSFDIIVKDRGTHFAPDVVDAFIVHADDFRRIREGVFNEKTAAKRPV